jgi:hypothetical protein
VIKLVSLFLVVIVVLAMFGKLGWIGKLAPRALRRKSLRCTACGRHVIGTKGCDCGKPPKG